MIKRAANLPATLQKEQIRQELAEYQGMYPQRDDITVIGFRLGNKK
jgi:serine phosphatase RsbU (regulator of sigma subunit)